MIKEETIAVEGLRAEFESMGEFEEFWRGQDLPSKRSTYLEAALAQIKKHGLWCEFHNRQALPQDIAIASENYRETIAFGSFNSRLRALNHEVFNIIRSVGDQNVRIYAPEAVTKFALAYRGRFPRFIGSEYSDDPKGSDRFFPIPVEDLQALTFPSAQFDLVVASEVFEHLPRLDKALKEIARVTRNGGWLASTFPFHAGSLHSIVKAVLKNGEIEYLTEPEYHGNPVDPKGSLVFEIPGWDILDRAKAAGFKSAKMVWHYSPRLGLLAKDMLGIILLLAQR